MVRGSCLCGGVAWELGAPLEWMSHCHCSMCRKVHGAAFGTYAGGPAEGFAWLSGRDLVRAYASGPDGFRRFCMRCGSVVPGDPADGSVFTPAGCLDDDPGIRPQSHIFVASKAPWHEISDDLPRFDAWPPEVQAGTVERRVEPPSRPDATRGTCLCGAAAYEVDGELELIVNCHCSRCRKAYSAAHASNLFVPGDRFRWIRGEAMGVSFKVPDAERFTQTFCRTCGSPLPRSGGERVKVPSGSLDGDAGARARLHIYVGSKAPWYEIADDLPRFEEAPPRAE